MRPVTPERNVPPAQSPEGISAACDDNSIQQLTPPNSDGSTPQTMTPSPTSSGMPAPRRYRSPIVAPRLRARKQPIDAASFIGVSQGGMLLWNSVDGDNPIVQMPVTVAERVVVYEHLGYSALQRVQTAPDKLIWLDALGDIVTAAMDMEGLLDESEIVRLNGYV